MSANILVVDDEKLIRWSICQRLREEGFKCVEAQDGATARARVADQEFDLALLDLRLPDTDGTVLLEELKGTLPELVAIVITAHSTVDSAVEAMKKGARDYVAKPFNLEELVITVRNALESRSMARRLKAEVTQQKARFGLSNIVGQSPAMVKIKNLVRKIAQGKTTTILLLGESGTGKDMAARAIHYESNRVDMPFMNITCTALPETLLDSELFGYEKGAFTDAREQKKGLFELADGGTVFLDEVGDMSASLQGKLLRVLEEKAFKRIGGGVDIGVDVRVIAATNRNLEEAIENDAFREDLYYRLNIVPIYLPPLRERREDIPVLADYFLEKANREFHHQFAGFSPRALRKLTGYGWPGNVRELRNAIERAVLLATGDTIGNDDVLLGRTLLGGRPQSGEYVVRLPDQGCDLSDIERDLVRQALERTNWNQTRAAKLVGISRDQVRYKMEKHEITQPGSPVDGD
jgi:two-component system, NtrC family, response regulator AtoC